MARKANGKWLGFANRVLDSSARTETIASPKTLYKEIFRWFEICGWRAGRLRRKQSR